MDRGKCKDPRATLILCASVMASGSAPVLVSAFGASADTSRRQEMQIGDLVLFRSDTVPGVIVAERRGEEQTKVHRIGVLWMDSINEVCWEPVEYLKVISENGEQK